mgnify:FL=1
MFKQIDDYTIFLHQKVVDYSHLKAVWWVKATLALWLGAGTLYRAFLGLHVILQGICFLVIGFAVVVLWGILTHFPELLRETNRDDGSRFWRLLVGAIFVLDVVQAAVSEPSALSTLGLINSYAAWATFCFMACGDPPPPRRREEWKLKEQS